MVVISAGDIIVGSILKRFAATGRIQPAVFDMTNIQQSVKVTVIHSIRSCPFMI